MLELNSITPGAGVAPLKEAILLLPLLALVTIVTVPKEEPEDVGINVTPTVHVPASANDAPVQLSEVSENGAPPPTITFEMFRFDVPPVFVTVNVCKPELPMETLPKSCVVGEILPVTVALVTPAPVNEAILSVPFDALVSTVSVPANAPVVVGSKSTPTSHVPAGAIDAPVHVSDVLRKGRFETVALDIVKFPVPPVLVIVNEVELELPTVTSPYAFVTGEMLAVTVKLVVTPFPMSEAILLVPSVALVATINVPMDEVATVGAKNTSMEHVPNEGMDAPVHVSAVLMKEGPEIVADEISRFPVPPVLVTVNVVELVLSTVTSP